MSSIGVAVDSKISSRCWDLSDSNGSWKTATNITLGSATSRYGEEEFPSLRKPLHNASCPITVSSQLESLESLQLTVGQNILLSSQTDQSRYVRLFFQQGIARISGSFGDHFPDITLAFCGDSESSWLRLPDGSNFLLEALTNSSIGLHYADNCPKDQDLLWDWLFDFHLVRHPVGAEARLVALLKLLIGRFGIRRSEGYELPFPLGHARMAELIGATRSTVTRQITLFRNKNDLQLIEPGGTFLLSARLIESTPAMDIRF
ncbi:hypothetical protein PMIT1318_01748 [Prochlorococcus marinus str. MIT 1318]|uniref:helix-turn-helix domain-containing protein n=1 Tax=Prochlorococcus TaxID=1218 RepID=UPI0007B3EF5D|nr:helix-turn-helix domain-containing protein [Prochlorococcus marinus]KZR71940.1 hypothetical protein PMIT1318_01748 [Prochlorococcus marinus str. MIT 1318]